MNTEIIPAIIPRDINDLAKKLSLLRGIISVVQVDILDGEFVQNTSYPYGEENKKHFASVLRGDAELPFIGEFYIEADLMIENPEERIEDFAFAGFKRIIAHIESTDNMDEVIAHARELDMEIGIAINIDTPDEILEPYAEKADCVQCMGIARIGFQGESFDRRVVEKVRTIRNKYPDIIISIDGGVHIKNIPYLLEAGVNRFVAGSAIFKSGNIEGAIREFKSFLSL